MRSRNPIDPLQFEQTARGKHDTELDIYSLNRRHAVLQASRQELCRRQCLREKTPSDQTPDPLPSYVALHFLPVSTALSGLRDGPRPSPEACRMSNRCESPSADQARRYRSVCRAGSPGSAVRAFLLRRGEHGKDIAESHSREKPG